MFHSLRRRVRSEKGFTLIELLVVILIIGILAAIAIPSFLGQRSKAQDSAAKSDARSAATAAETYYTDNQTYVGMTDLLLEVIEPTLNDANVFTVSGLAANTYTVAATSKSADATVYSVNRLATGRTTRTCDDAGKGGCKTGGVW